MKIEHVIEGRNRRDVEVIAEQMKKNGWEETGRGKKGRGIVRNYNIYWIRLGNTGK